MSIKNTPLIPFASGTQDVGSSDRPWNDIYANSGIFTNRPTVDGVEVAIVTDPLGGGGAQFLGQLDDVDTSTVGNGSGLAFDGNQWIPSGMISEISGIIRGGITLEPADQYISISLESPDFLERARFVFENNGVQALNGLSKVLNLVSLDGSLNISTPGSQQINLQAVANPSLFPVDGRVASGHIIPDTDSAYTVGLTDRRWLHLYSDFGTFTNRPTVGGTFVALTTDSLPSSGVISLNGLSGTINIQSLNDSINVASLGNNVTLEGLYTRASGALTDSKLGQLINNSGFPTFNELLDVNVSNAASGQVAVFDGSNWVARTNIAGSVGSINSISGEISLISANDGIAVSTLGEPTNEITLTSLFTSSTQQTIDQLVQASGFPDLNQLLGVNIANPAVVSGQVIVFDGANWVARDQEAGVRTINTVSGDLTFISSDASISIDTPTTTSVDFTISPRFPQKRSFQFTEASGSRMIFYHDLNTQDFTWSLYRQADFTGSRFNILPDRITPSGTGRIVVELNQPTSGYLVVVG